MSFRFYVLLGPGPVCNTNTFYLASTGREITYKLDYPKGQVQILRDPGPMQDVKTATLVHSPWCYTFDAYLRVS